MRRPSLVCRNLQIERGLLPCLRAKTREDRLVDSETRLSQRGANGIPSHQWMTTICEEPCSKTPRHECQMTGFALIRKASSGDNGPGESRFVATPNRTQFGWIGTDITTASFGQVSSPSNTPRQLQLEGVVRF